MEVFHESVPEAGGVASARRPRHKIQDRNGRCEVIAVEFMNPPKRDTPDTVAGRKLGLLKNDPIGREKISGVKFGVGLLRLPALSERLLRGAQRRSEAVGSDHGHSDKNGRRIPHSERIILYLSTAAENCQK